MVWMAISQGRCECGNVFKIAPEDQVGYRDDELQSVILDAHAEHVDWIKSQG